MNVEVVLACTRLVSSKMNVALHEAARDIDVLGEIEDERKATSAVTRVQFASQDWL